MPNTLSAVRSFICHNQKQIIMYEHMVSTMHKDLRLYWRDQKEDPARKEEVKVKFDEFIMDTFFAMIDAFHSNQVVMSKVFESLGKNSLPRMTIKTILNDEVVSVYRSTSAVDFSKSRIESNTGFDSILRDDNVSKFLSNDLPSLYREGKYKNPRLDEERCKLFLKGEIDWSECWNQSDRDKDKGKKVDFYRSTLILPMSLRATEADKSAPFYKHFFDEGKDRVIWGFLCFDSEETGYFDSNMESDFENVGYIMADTLSHYLIHFYNHVTASSLMGEITTALNS